MTVCGLLILVLELRFIFTTAWFLALWIKITKAGDPYLTVSPKNTSQTNYVKAKPALFEFDNISIMFGLGLMMTTPPHLLVLTPFSRPVS